MIDKDLFIKLQALEIKYEETWGKKIDYSILPNDLSQEKLIKIIEDMIENNNSLIVSYKKLYKYK